MESKNRVSPSTTAYLKSLIERQGVVAPMALRIHCPKCNGALTLQTDAWSPSQDSVLVDEDLPPQAWSCPYCGGPSCVRMEARLAWVVAGHVPDVET